MCERVRDVRGRAETRGLRGRTLARLVLFLFGGSQALSPVGEAGAVRGPSRRPRSCLVSSSEAETAGGAPVNDIPAASLVSTPGGGARILEKREIHSSVLAASFGPPPGGGAGIYTPPDGAHRP